MRDCPKDHDERGSIAALPGGNPIAFIDAGRQRMDEAELLRAVRRALERLPVDGMLKVLAREQPQQVIDHLVNCGYQVRSKKRRDGTRDIEVTRSNTPEILDLRSLEAPEPMRRVLLATAALERGALFLVRLPHVPHPLFPLLAERDLRWWVHEEPDHSALLSIRRAARP